MQLDHVNDFFLTKKALVFITLPLLFVYFFVLILNNGSISELIN